MSLGRGGKVGRVMRFERGGKEYELLRGELLGEAGFWHVTVRAVGPVE